MGKTIVGRSYIPKGCIAMDATTGMSVNLDEKEYHIVRDVYVRTMTVKSDKGREYKLDREVIDVIDMLSGRKYIVEYIPENAVENPDVEQEFATEVTDDFLAAAKEFMLKWRKEHKSGDGNALVMIASHKKEGGEMETLGVVTGDTRQVAVSVTEALKQKPSVAGVIGAAAMAARFGI